jgi:seryl-tRNA synthetase
MQNYRVLTVLFGQFKRGDVIPEVHTLQAGGPQRLLHIGAIEKTTDAVTVNVPPPKFESDSTVDLTDMNHELTITVDDLRRKNEYLEKEIALLAGQSADFERACIEASKEVSRLKLLVEEAESKLAEANKSLEELTAPK